MRTFPRALALVTLVVALFGGAPAGQGAAPQTSTSVVTIAGSVVDSDLKPLPGVTVTLASGTRVVATKVSDSAGLFTFEKVAPGSYRVRAELKGFTPTNRDVTVHATPARQRLPLVLTVVGFREAVSESMSDRNARGGVPMAGSMPAVASPSPPPPPAAPRPAGGVGQGQSSGVAGGVAGGMSGGGRGRGGASNSAGRPYVVDGIEMYPGRPYYTGEDYAHVARNRFQRTSEHPLSTFGADVDTASFANVRRFLNSGQLPPEDAVRVEEFVNYFKFNYAEPRGPRPIAMTTEVGDAPWAPGHKLVLIGARAKAPAPREIEGRNIVLLIDVSGSMAPPERLPLIKSALGMFVNTLQGDDRIAIVTYAGTSGLALPSTSVRNRDVIHRAIDGLAAGGSTNGGQGLIMAYRTARQSYIPGGVNRVILASDGDFNVGIVNQVDLLTLIERERDSGVFLSVFGVGSGNLKDATMEMIANRGNGHYSYLDSLQEAHRVLIREGNATLETVAKDVKFQVEFNPALVSAWKLIGYENRVLAARDFNNDRKDAGEMGAGHLVTVLYEVVPVGTPLPDGDRGDDRADVDPLRYQTEVRPPARPAPPVSESAASTSGELLTVKVRYKLPEADESQLMEQAVRSGGRTVNLPFAAAVAEFGLLLRDNRASLERWDTLVRRLRTIEAPTASAASDRASLTELVDLAAGLKRLRR